MHLHGAARRTRVESWTMVSSACLAARLLSPPARCPCHGGGVVGDLAGVPHCPGVAAAAVPWLAESPLSAIAFAHLVWALG